jgi:hypothetical protein
MTNNTGVFTTLAVGGIAAIAALAIGWGGYKLVTGKQMGGGLVRYDTPQYEWGGTDMVAF